MSANLWPLAAEQLNDQRTNSTLGNREANCTKPINDTEWLELGKFTFRVLQLLYLPMPGIELIEMAKKHLVG